MKRKDTIQMEYEGDKSNHETLICVWKMNGVEKFRMKYTDMRVIAAIYSTHYRITEQILQWAQMLHNPD